MTFNFIKSDVLIKQLIDIQIWWVCSINVFCVVSVVLWRGQWEKIGKAVYI